MTHRASLALPAVLLSLHTLVAPAGAFADGTTPSPQPDPGLSQSIEDDQAIASDDAVLEEGHVDLAPRFLDGAWTLMVHDDTRVEGSVWRPLEHTVVRVRDAAVQRVPDDPAYAFLGSAAGGAVHVVPQTQNPEVVWLGWNTQDPEVMTRVDRGVTMSLSDVEGPGDLVVFLQDGGFGEPDPLWSSRPGEGEPLYVEVNTHTHANWAFTAPGEYAVGIDVTAALLDGTEVTTTGTVRFAVGEAASTDAALALPDLAASDEAAPDASASGTSDASESGSSTDDGGGVATGLLVVAGLTAILVVVAILVVMRGRSARTRALDSAGTT